MLIDAEVLNEEQLRHFLDEQKKTGMKLGKLLIQQGILSETQMVDLLSQQLKIEKYHPDKYPVDLNLAQVFPADIAQKSQVAPLKKKGRLLTIAMTDPVDINTLDYIESLTNEECSRVSRS
jgi:type IV pilus assembly protein PilB